MIIHAYVAVIMYVAMYIDTLHVMFTTVRTQSPPAGNSPKLLRRRTDLLPSTLDQDSPQYDYNTG